MAKLYVGNLPFSLDEQGVRRIFEQFGPVTDVVLIMDRDTGRPRGFGFVEMSDEDCETAVAKMNGQRVEGRVLKVDIARERAPRPPRGRMRP
jgi:RNA recognition motif-containing protein